VIDSVVTLTLSPGDGLGVGEPRPEFTITLAAPVVCRAPYSRKDYSMPAISPITILDYKQAISRDTGRGDGSFDPDEVLPHGCEICQTPLTIDRAYPARFGTSRCRQCIGADGFATAMALDDFRNTGIVDCPECSIPMLPAEISLDLLSCKYQCTACGASVRFTTRLPG
jgi:hypothetical protein